MSTGRLLELWTPPPGFRLASIVATTYQLQADFIEEDLLPVVLGLRLPAARGRDFRLELEQALQDVEVTIYLHPDGYQAGLRRSPRIDLVPLPETRLPKLHAKVGLLRFVPDGGAPAGEHVVRLIVGSANLTSPGFRDNIEVALALNDAPDEEAQSITAVRDAAAWMIATIPATTDQARRQHRDMEAVFAARPVGAKRDGMRFVGLPTKGGLIAALKQSEIAEVDTLTLVSPFWPTGDEPADVVDGLIRACGARPRQVRLLGTARQDSDGHIYPEMPVALLRSLLEQNVGVAVAAADPSFGSQKPDADEADEFGDFARRSVSTQAARALHAKMILFEGKRNGVLAIGSFNLTRKGLGLHGQGNTEAGVIWSLPSRETKFFQSLLAFATPWKIVDRSPELMVRAPPLMDGDGGALWPAFVRGVRATRDAIIVEGDGSLWPTKVALRMRDLRSRIEQLDRDFDSWVVLRPNQPGPFEAQLTMAATWIAEVGATHAGKYPPIPDLEIELAWEGVRAILPVVFVDKHEFPVVERARREDERALIDWFLGLRPVGESDGEGFAHSIDPTDLPAHQDAGDTTDILSYLIRDFVHALPGIRVRLNEGATTETGLRAALLGPRSPVALANEVITAWRVQQPGRPRKTPVATAFQLVELLKLLREAAFPGFPAEISEGLREQSMTRIGCALAEVLLALPIQARTPALKDYLESAQGDSHAST